MTNFYKKNKTAIFIGILIIGFFLRLAYATHLPVTNDEGSYLYDGLLLSQGKWPFNYSFSRSPALMFLVAPTVAIFGRSYLAGRAISIFAGLGSAVVLYFMGKRLFNKRVGFIAFAMFALLAPPVVHTSYLLTQPLEILFVLLGIYFTWLGISSSSPSEARRLFPSFARFAFAGVFFGLAVLTRETAAFYPMAMVLAILLFSPKLRSSAVSPSEVRRLPPSFARDIARRLVSAFLMGLSSLAVWGGVWGLIVSRVGFARVKAIFTAITSMHDTGEYWSFGFKLKKKWEIFYGALGENFILYALAVVFAVFVVIKVVEFLKGDKEDRGRVISAYADKRDWPCTTWGARFAKERDLRRLGFFLFYAAVPVLFYGIYYRRMQAEYLAEFMPVFVLMGAVAVNFLILCASRCSSGLQSAIKREINFATTRLCWLIIAVVLLPILFINYRYMWNNQHGGTFAPEALAEAEEFVRENVGEEEEIFTAAVIVPFLADRPLAFKMSRPVIFGYPHLGSEIKYTLFPRDEEILTYLEEKPVKWAIFDRTTWETFSRGHPELEEYLKETYNIVKEIPNERTGNLLEIGSRDD